MNARARALVLALLGGILPSVGPAQADSTPPGRVALSGIDGRPFGYVVLGASRPPEAGRVLDSVGGLGPKRVNSVTFTVGSARLRPRDLYTPPATMNQLYFDQGVLVLLVEGIPRGLPGSRTEFVARFPDARETHREAGWYELQTPLDECVWLIAVFRVSDDKLESDGHAFTCGKR